MIDEKNMPNIKTVNLVFLLMLFLLLVSSIILIPLVGIGLNVWVNELVWILGIILVFTRKNKWSFKETFYFNKVKTSTNMLSIILGMSMWFISMYIYTVIDKVLTFHIGSMPPVEISETPLNLFLYITGVLILAPFCEEIFFRGFMQRAYERYNKKYSWLIVGIIFGVFHVSNGIADVFSATILGIIIGYVLYLTNSIWPSIFIHMGNNLASMLFSGYLVEVLDENILPYWYAVFMFFSLVIAVGIIIYIKKKRSVDKFDELGEKKDSGIIPFVPLILAAVIMFFPLFSEIAVRGGILEIEGEYIDKEYIDSGYCNFTVEEHGENKAITLDHFYLEEESKVILEWALEAEGKYCDIVFKIISPEGLSAYEEKYAAENLKFSASNTLEIEGEGEWKFIIDGPVEKFKFDFEWNISEQNNR